MAASEHMQGQSYESALNALGGLISGKKRPDGSSWAHAFESMPTHLQRLALDTQLQDLHIVHVAGTKGKGSTCALVESILRSCGYRTGLYTSPHLCDVRERIRLDGKPIDQDRFLKHFWHVYDTLKRQVDDTLAMPAYFRFLTLLALHVFLEEGVEAVVLEVGLGGRLDATNCIPPPAVTAVTPLGFDHMELLGNTLREIAGEKAGIFKHGSPAFTIPQADEAMQSLQVKAEAAGVDLRVVPPWATYTAVCPSPTAADSSGAQAQTEAAPSLQAVERKLRSQGEHQLMNAALAVQLAASWEQRTAKAVGVVSSKGNVEPGSTATYVAASQSESHAGGAAAAAGATGDTFHARLREGVRRASQVAGGMLPVEYASGLLKAHWPGRCQVIEDSGVEAPSTLTFYLDGAHTPESMLVAADWFATETATAAAADQVMQGGRRDPPATADAVGTRQGPSAGTLSPLRLLLFHCMDDRDPRTLLAPLLERLRQKGAPITHALFVPPDSAYANLSKEQSLPDSVARYAWHANMRTVYESLHQQRSTSSPPAVHLPQLPMLPTVPGVPAPQQACRGAVLPNLSTTIEWLRATAKQSGPKAMFGKVQVLVTGSLYLVGDMLRQLGKAP